MTPRMGARLDGCLLLLPGLAVLMLYWPTLLYGLVWDDHTFFGADGVFSDWQALPGALSSAVLDSSNYFRPAAMLFLGLEHLLSGGNPMAGHAIGIVLHALNATLVGVLGMLAGRQVSGAGRGALLVAVAAGLLYGMHPVLIETVAWISGRFDQLVTLFCLLCLVADRLIASTLTRTLAMSLLFLCAALSKEMAAGLALALPAWHLFFERPAPDSRWWAVFRARGYLWVYAGIFAAGVVYLFLRHQALGYLHQPASFVPFSAPVEHLLVVLKTLGTFWTLALAPFVTIGPIHPIGGYLSFFDREVLIALLMLALILIGSWRALRAGSRVPLLALCGLLSSWPVLNLIRIENRDNLINDRFLALPLVFLVLAVSLLAWQVLRPGMRRMAMISVLSLWLLLCTLTIRSVLPHWQDDLRFWLWTYRLVPQNVSAGTNLQALLLKAGYLEATLKVSEEMLVHGGGHIGSLQRTNYAKALCFSQRCDEAMVQMLSAIAELPQIYTELERGSVYSTAGWVNYEAGHLVAAAQYLRQAVRMVPDAADTWYLLGVVETAMGQEQATGSLTKAYALMAPKLARQRRDELPALVLKARERSKRPLELMK